MLSPTGLCLHWLKEPATNIASVLQKLESNYNQMRDKRLRPLSIDSGRTSIGASYIPAQVRLSLIKSNVRKLQTFYILATSVAAVL